MSDQDLTQRTAQQLYHRFDGALYCFRSDEKREAGGELSASQLLVAAAANCLTAGLLFSAGKLQLDLEPLSCQATATIARNEHGRLRVSRIDVTLQSGKKMQGQANLGLLLDTFQDFCTVAQSIGQGIPVALTVLDQDGALLKSSAM